MECGALFSFRWHLGRILSSVEAMFHRGGDYATLSRVQIYRNNRGRTPARNLAPLDQGAALNRAGPEQSPPRVRAAETRGRPRRLRVLPSDPFHSDAGPVRAARRHRPGPGTSNELRQPCRRNLDRYRGIPRFLLIRPLREQSRSAATTQSSWCRKFLRGSNQE